MNEEKNAHTLPRRQFIALSGAVGAATIVTGAGATGRAVAADDPGYGEDPCTCPTPPTSPPGAGQSPCPPSQMQALCGRLTDNDPLWHDVQYCTRGIVPPAPQPKPNCLKTTPNYVVLHGKPENQHNYLLLPSCRVTGIECPFLVTSSVANYWMDAWENARSLPVHYADIGLGINSKGARRFDQMHIHLAGVRPSTVRRLQDLDTMGRMATHPAQWAATASQAPITGTPGSGDRTYRILKLTDLRQNLFMLLNQHVVRPNGLSMADQTLIVVPSTTAAGLVFYVLNSDTSLHGGTSTCDYLLVYA